MMTTMIVGKMKNYKIRDDLQLEEYENRLQDLSCKNNETQSEDQEIQELKNLIQEYKENSNFDNRDYKILPTEGLEGYLLYNPIGNYYWFRIYSEDRKTHTDYKMCVEDLQIKITGNYIKRYEYKDGKNRLDYYTK